MHAFIFYTLIFFLIILLWGSVWSYKKPSGVSLPLNPIETADTEFSSVDCTLSTRFCSHDLQCKVLCSSEKFIHKFKCNLDSGVCDLEESTTDVNAQCPAERGFLSVLRTTEIDNQWVCINTMPHLFDNNGDLQKYVCGVGDGVGTFDLNEFNVEIDDSNSILSRCVCSENYTRVVNKTRPNIPLCIPRNMMHILPDFTVM